LSEPQKRYINTLPFLFLCLAPMGVKFGTEEGNFGPLLRAKFHPIGATCDPCGAKSVKIGLRVN